MKFDELGLPKDEGAGDRQDSARLAGIMAVFGHEKAPGLVLYVDAKGKYVRHPSERQYKFSRDQAVCLMAGLCVQGWHNLVSIDRVDGHDIWSPSQRGHVRRCQGLRPKWWQELWLWLDVVWSAKVRPSAEINQLFCMLMLARPVYLSKFLRWHKSWRKNLRGYWGGWRRELELAELMIKVLEERR